MAWPSQAPTWSLDVTSASRRCYIDRHVPAPVGGMTAIDSGALDVELVNAR
jgi:hypothetical protein